MSRHFAITAAGLLALLALLGGARAGGPASVAGVTFFQDGLAGTPITWRDGSVAYYTDQGALSPLLSQSDANALVADAFARWTSVPTAAVAAQRAGQLDEDVNGSNVTYSGGALIYGHIRFVCGVDGRCQLRFAFGVKGEAAREQDQRFPPAHRPQRLC